MKVLKTKEIIQGRGKDNGKDGYFYYTVPNKFKVIGDVVFTGTKAECDKFCINQY